MKTLFIAAVCMVLFMTNGYAQTTFGIRAGVNIQNLTGKDDQGDKYSNKLRTGFNIGANVELPVATDFYLQPGVLFSTKGAKYTGGTIGLSYIEIPVNFIYKAPLGDGKLLLGVGPYAGFAVGGKDKFNGTSESINFDKENGDFKRFDAGGNFLVGYELSNNFSAQLNAGLGLVNINRRLDGDTRSAVKNTGFGISLGYRFP